MTERAKGWWRLPSPWTVRFWERGRPAQNPAEASRRRARRARRHAATTRFPMPHLCTPKKRVVPKRSGQRPWSMAWTTRTGEHVTVVGGFRRTKRDGREKSRSRVRVTA